MVHTLPLELLNGDVIDDIDVSYEKLPRHRHFCGFLCHEWDGCVLRDKLMKAIEDEKDPDTKLELLSLHKDPLSSVTSSSDLHQTTAKGTEAIDMEEASSRSPSNLTTAGALIDTGNGDPPSHHLDLASPGPEIAEKLVETINSDKLDDPTIRVWERPDNSTSVCSTPNR
uniref:Uncharacterized protein n=1 Tax=Nelumbo nucifera TaxID=4432 RepID=A0A822XYH4_NELNU|nr:TPA_asm: hypothetical protein HUJ06_025622 [Nelumbo nucifera]